MNRLETVLLVVLFCSGSVLGQSRPEVWRAGKAPLMTKWAEDVTPDSVLPEYPRPVMVRSDWMNLNGLWQFQEANSNDPAPFGKRLSETILVPFPWQSALSGVRRALESYRAWYRRSFSVPADWNGRRTLLHFGAVDWEAVVYVNGGFVGSHQGGYDPFSFDITTFLREGEENELIVGVFDPGNLKGIARGKQSNDRFSDPQRYSYAPVSGIWQTAWLEPVPRNFIEGLQIVPDVDGSKIRVEATAATPSAKLNIEVVASSGGVVMGKGTGEANSLVSVSIPAPRLWSPEDPHLYDLEISLKDDRGVLLDSVQSYCGMRKISLGKFDVGNREGLVKILLNDQFFFQMGPLDQGYWPDGLYTAPTDEALRWDIEEMKRYGFNMVRKHIKVEPQRWYTWCDRVGILVWQDMPGTFAVRNGEEKTQFELELARMVKGHWNHPSIVNWIVFNEHWGAYDVPRLTEYVMDLDPTRLVTGNSGIEAGEPDLDYEVGHIKDAHHYRPPINPTPTTRRAVVNGEYGAIGYKIEGHIWDIDGPWVHHNYGGKEEATVEYESFTQMILGFKRDSSLSGAVYTQWTDVENEMNGIYTYDRKVEKFWRERILKCNESTYADDLKEVPSREVRAEP